MKAKIYNMKRISNLYEQICNPENLKLADESARKGKHKSYGVKLHDKNRDKNINNIHRMLVEKTFKTSQYTIFKIHEPKERVIYRLPYYPDRIVHHAIMNILEPLWVKTFTSDCYSCIKGRGIHGIVKKLKSCLKKDSENTRYCLKLDVKKFYPSIDHSVLKQIIRRKIKDRDLLWLLDEIINSAPGVPIGNYLSQYFANLYLTYLDHFLKEEHKIKYYFRYCDDMVILASSKEELHFIFAQINKYLSVKLKLEIKSNYQIFPVKKRGIDFVGYKFYHSHTLLRKSIKKRFAKAILKKKANLLQTYAAYWGWCKYCNSNNLLRKLSA